MKPRVLSVCMALLLSLVMLLPASVQSETVSDQLRPFLEQHYSITILMGAECASVSPPEGYVVSVEAVSLDDLLMCLDDAFSVYPPGFFSRFPLYGIEGGLRFLLVDEITFGNIHCDGLFNFTGQDYLDIWLSRTDTGERAIHHEIGHALDYRIRCADPDAFAGWEDLNPEGFAYSGDFSIMGTSEADEEPDDWFARTYGMIDPDEDRATVYEALILKDADWWDARPRLSNKARFLMDRIDEYTAPVSIP